MSKPYQDLDWDSINVIKTHLYSRFASPLNNALGRLAIAHHLKESDDVGDQSKQAEQNLEMALNLLKAWAALVFIETGGVIGEAQRHAIAATALPLWLVDTLGKQTTLRTDYTRPVFVHPETFYESLILLCQIGAAVGKLKALVLSDASGSKTGVWVRAVFEPEKPYTSLKNMSTGLDPDSAADEDIAWQIQVVTGLLKLNEARFTLQNNVQTTEQALAALLPVASPAQQPAAQGGESAERLSEGERPAGDQAQNDPADDQAPILAGPVLARLPRKTFDVLLEPPDTPAPVLGGSVLAELRPAKSAEPETDPPPVDNEPETLIVPPPDFRLRQVTLTPLPKPDPKPNGKDEATAPGEPDDSQTPGQAGSL